MSRFEPVIIPKGSFKRKKVKTIDWREGLSGDIIDQIMIESEQNGFLCIPYQERKIQTYFALCNTYINFCQLKTRCYVEVFVDKEKQRAFASFDTIAWGQENQTFNFTPMTLEILNKEFETYYDRLDLKEKKQLFLPADMNPYKQSYHKINYFILPKQICFSFKLEQPQLFDYMLNKIHLLRV